MKPTSRAVKQTRICGGEKANILAAPSDMWLCGTALALDKGPNSTISCAVNGVVAPSYGARMSLRAREGRETPPRDESHDSVPVQYLQRSTSLTSDDHQFGLHSPAPVSRGLAELEPHITTSEATRTRGSSDSTPLDYIDAPTNSSESQVSPVKCSHKEPPPLWKVWWLEVGSILLSVISFISKSDRSRSM